MTDPTDAGPVSGPETCPYCARKPRYGAGGLCGVHQSRKLAGEPMVQPHDLVGLQASGYGFLGVMDRTATHLMCHECGRWFKALGTHILTHDMTSGEYRALHQLAAKTPLVSTDLSEVISAHSMAQLGTPAWKRFEERRDATNPESRKLAAQAARSRTAGAVAGVVKKPRRRVAAVDLPAEGEWLDQMQALVDFMRTHQRAPLRTVAAERPLARWAAYQRATANRGTLSPARRERLAGIGFDFAPPKGAPSTQAKVEARAVARGWASMAEAITATADLSLSEAGRRLGVSHDTVQRWRIRLLHHG